MRDSLPAPFPLPSTCYFLGDHHLINPRRGRALPEGTESTRAAAERAGEERGLAERREARSRREVGGMGGSPPPGPGLRGAARVARNLQSAGYAAGAQGLGGVGAAGTPWHPQVPPLSTHRALAPRSLIFFPFSTSLTILKIPVFSFKLCSFLLCSKVPEYC